MDNTNIDSPQNSQEALEGYLASPAPKHQDMNEEGVWVLVVIQAE